MSGRSRGMWARSKIWLLTFRMNVNSPSSNKNKSSRILLFFQFLNLYFDSFSVFCILFFLMALLTWNIFSRIALTFSHDAHSADCNWTLLVEQKIMSHAMITCTVQDITLELTIVLRSGADKQPQLSTVALPTRALISLLSERGSVGCSAVFLNLFVWSSFFFNHWSISVEGIILQIVVPDV